ncbi:TetR/AcrR family transcriptional regulator [Nonomuraea sp. NPDC049269]|uniref:TetR/AcrR family transcriptional regulator n=2 Tax=unclassified Nonomuraea TaxID=2593643 RepID=UPI003722BC49
MRQGSPVRRAAIMRAALEAFLQEGFARTSVDTIATKAGVSKRTIYDYYQDKEQLFLSVIQEAGATRNAEFGDLLDRTLGQVHDLEAALLAFGREFAHAVVRCPERSAITRLMIAEAVHFPELLDAWRPVGPAQRELAARLARLGEQGLLDVPDPVVAAEHLEVLVAGVLSNRSLFGAAPLGEGEIERVVIDGVKAFLRAYRTKPDTP